MKIRSLVTFYRDGKFIAPGTLLEMNDTEAQVNIARKFAEPVVEEAPAPEPEPVAEPEAEPVSELVDLPATEPEAEPVVEEATRQAGQVPAKKASKKGK